ncbi:MFS transporter [Rhodobacterales bacterium HKCCE2091]|nr:MFS transporter [Rhodobacterales bacterium HKCCE2091]
MSLMSDAPAPAASDHAVPVRLVLGAVSLTLLFASLGQTIVSPALPTIVAELGGLDHITWAITAYLLASTVGAPISGKLGDLYGRKVVLQGAILIFLVGAALCGLAGTMGMLIAGRAVQGGAAGAIIVLSMAVVADVLPPRERGRAQGLLGAAFGVSTVIGPLLGGFLVEALSWHWIFLVNVPVGIVAFAVLAAALKRPPAGGRKSIDYLGAALLAAFLAAAVLLSNFGGTVLPWTGPGAWALAALVAVSLIGFVLVEKRAEEPVLPLSLFRVNAFLVVNAMGFLVGVALFSTVTFIPLFLQTAKALSPTASGLFLLPMMGGLILSSALAGQVMTRTGRYRWMPIASTALLAVSLLGMSRVGADTPLWLIALALAGVGTGLGPVFSIGVAAIQNAVPMHMLGVGTASANMFRLIGGSLGTALFGALFSAGLARRLDGVLPAGTEGGLGSMSPAVVAGLPPDIQHRVIEGISASLHPLFAIAAVGAAIACLVGTRLKETPLATTLPGRG